MTTHRVFVYGTLKSGLWNNGLLAGIAHTDAVTKDKYKMQSGRVPFLLAGDVAQVRGEVYEVDDHVLRRLDLLEGYDPGHHGRGTYNREKIDVLLRSDNGFNRPAKAYAYIVNRDVARPYTELDADGYIDWRPLEAGLQL
jgi:gamma-glutamylcyclotransferase (GGCT)/AIG2-like uncharacterized protein YtfP